MSYPINYPTPQGANIQIFRGDDGIVANHIITKDWVKPQGASFVWFTLIGAGGGGDNATQGGGSGAVTNFMCPAFLIPDRLTVTIGRGSAINATATETSIYYVEKTGAGYLLLNALGGNVGGAGPTASNYFTAMGFYQSTAGEGGNSTPASPSATTFLSGGSGSTDPNPANYGYQLGTNANANGFFQMQPIIVGVGGAGQGKGGTGCGGGYQGRGGDGMAVIITW